MAEETQEADEKQPASVSNNYRRIFIVSSKHSYTMAITEEGKVIAKDPMKNGTEGVSMRLEKSAKDGVVFIASNQDPSKVLASDCDGNVITTADRSADGAEAWKLEPRANDMKLIVSVKFGRVLAIDAEGKVQTIKHGAPVGGKDTNLFFEESSAIGVFIHSVRWARQIAINETPEVRTTGNRVWHGWEGLALEHDPTDDAVFYIYAQRYPLLLLSCKEGTVFIKSSATRDPNGYEAWELSYAEDGIQFFVSHTQKDSSGKNYVLAINKEYEVVTTTNRAAGGWEGFRVEIVTPDVVRNPIPAANASTY